MLIVLQDFEDRTMIRFVVAVLLSGYWLSAARKKIEVDGCCRRLSLERRVYTSEAALVFACCCYSASLLRRAVVFAECPTFLLGSA